MLQICSAYGLSYDNVSWRKIKEKENKKDQKQANFVMTWMTDI